MPNKDKSKTVMHIKPSRFVKATRIYQLWCSLTECKKCGQIGKYEDQHPNDPCTNCGHKEFNEIVGRWVPIYNKVPWWNFWKNRDSGEGHWEKERDVW
jgi:hypothetical protein